MKVQTAPETFVPNEATARFRSTVLTVVPEVTVAVPMSMPHSARAKLPSAVPKIDWAVMTPVGLLRIGAGHRR